jgi:hypothetical protein
MTTPAPSMPFNGTTSNALNVTQSAQGQFQESVNYLSQVITNILDSSQQLTSSAMISQAGNAFGGAVGAWAEKAGDIMNNLQNMTDYLGLQIQVLEQNEDNNTALATGLNNLTVPTFI